MALLPRNIALSLSLALQICACASVTACAEQARAPAEVSLSAPADPADNWEPGKDLAGTQVVVGGVSQEIPADVAEAKRKLDAVEADYRAEMDELEKQRLKNLAPDADIRP